jgi:hypothetical protein
MSHHKFLTLALFAGLLFNTIETNAQAKHAIGIGPALNGNKDGMGFGGTLLGEIKVAKAFSIVPAIGVEIPYVGYVALGAKYYFHRSMYTNLGALLHIGGEDGADSGIGGSLGIGGALLAGKRNLLDLNLHGDAIKMDGDLAPVVGLRLTYQFSFSKYR